MTENWNNLALVALGTGALIVGIEVLWRALGEPRGWPHEVARKAHHVGIGLIGAFLNQWLLSPWTGFFLGLGFGSILVAGWKFRFMRSLFDARAVQDRSIRRWSHSWVGPAAFAIAVSVLSILFWDDVPIYRASMLILALGDSAATTFGLLLGRHRYVLFGSRRSLEGNMALVVLATAVCLATLPERGAEAMVFAWLMGVFLCLAEAISPFGIDNFTVPLSAAGILLLARAGVPGALAVDTRGLTALALVTAAAWAFTVAHLRPRWRHAAVLAMGTAVLLLAEMSLAAPLWLLAAFVAVALAAERSAPIPALAGQGILTQLVPSAGFVALSAATGNSSFLVGSLASLTVVGRRCWSALSDSPARPARRLALDSLTGTGGAWAALVAAAGATLLFDLGRVEASVLAIVLASIAGGLLSAIGQGFFGPPQEEEPESPAETEPLVHQFVPALLAIGAIPLVSVLLVGIAG